MLRSSGGRDGRQALAALLAVVAIASALYLTFLSYAPIYLAHDEVNFGLTAHAIAYTGRDLNGERLPLVFHIVSRSGHYFTTPVVIYTTALFLRLLPISAWAIRFPTALVGVLDVVLMFFVARMVFRRNTLAAAAALFLALMPAHFIHARLAVDPIYPVFFVLAWLYCLGRFLETDGLAWIGAAATLLAVGVFSYLASMVMMPLYFVMTLAVLWARRARRAAFVVTVAGFSWPLVLLASWFLAQPARFHELLSLYELSDAGGSPVRSVLRLFTFFSLGVRSGVYYDFFNPSMLFFSGDGSLLSSTRQAGVFLLPFAALLPLGIYHVLAHHRRPLPLLVLAGFLTAPLAAVIALAVTIHRALVMLPFGALLAVYGVEWIWLQPRRWRVAGVVLLGLMPLQFAWFYRDYLTDYRVRSAFWFERDQRGAVEAVIAREPAGHPAPVYLSADILWIESNWRLFALTHRREDLLDLPVYYDPQQLRADALPSGAFVVSEGADPGVRRMVESGALREVARVTEPDGRFSYVVLYKT
jgi:4-amino-4-deoxy-L-arabinose transferase-like glycosyltransferase